MEDENQEWKESDEHRQKRYEELYKYSKEVYDEQKKRVENVELKAARFLPLLALLLGVGAIGIKETAVILKISPGISVFFVIPYFFFYITSICSIFAFLGTVAIRSVKSPSVDENVIEYFNQHQYLAIIYSFSHSYLEYARAASETARRKYEALKWAYRMLVASVILAFMSTLGYIITQLYNH